MSGTIGFGGSPVSLGDFAFQGFEVPQSIRWGGQHRLTVHKLVGGTRVIDAMGRDDADIPWSGILLSADASDRADQLDLMRVSGDVQELTFLGRSYLVVVREFVADQRKVNHVPYRITCTVLQDQSAIVYAQAETPQEAVTNDVNVVVLMPVPDVLVPVQATLVPVQTSLATAAAIDAETQAADTMLANVLLARQQAAAVRDAADVTLAANYPDAVVGTVGDAAATALAMQAVVAATEEAANAVVMTSYLGRAGANIQGL